VERRGDPDGLAEFPTPCADLGDVLVLGAGKKRRGRKGETQQRGAPDEGVCLSFLHLGK
jgi:hypothetical protein